MGSCVFWWLEKIALSYDLKTCSPPQLFGQDFVVNCATYTRVHTVIDVLRIIAIIVIVVLKCYNTVVVVRRASWLSVELQSVSFLMKTARQGQ